MSIRWENGNFLPSGAALLDEALVNDPLRWLRGKRYESVSSAFEKSLRHLMGAHRRPELLGDAITDAYEALEALAQIVTGRGKDLSGNQELLVSKLKVSTEYKPILSKYIAYANKFRHPVQEGTVRPQISNAEVESFIYLTGSVIRLAMDNDDVTNEQEPPVDQS